MEFAIVAKKSAKLASLHKIVPVNWFQDTNKKKYKKTNTCMTYYYSNMSEKPNFAIGNYKKVKKYESEGTFKVYILKFCGKFHISITSLNTKLSYLPY
jgi:hypothetical protein